MSEGLPWNRQDIFHDEIVNYPLNDYFPLENSGIEKRKQFSDTEPLNPLVLDKEVAK